MALQPVSPVPERDASIRDARIAAQILSLNSALLRSRVQSSARTSRRSPEEAEVPASCHPSVTLSPLAIGRSSGSALLRPRPLPPLARPRRRGGSDSAPRPRAGPPSCQLRGRPGRRALAGWVLAGSCSSAASRRPWGSRGRQSSVHRRLAPALLPARLVALAPSDPE